MTKKPEKSGWNDRGMWYAPVDDLEMARMLSVDGSLSGLLKKARKINAVNEIISIRRRAIYELQKLRAQHAQVQLLLAAVKLLEEDWQRAAPSAPPTHRINAVLQAAHTLRQELFGI